MAELDFEETVSNLFFVDSVGYVEINPFSLLWCNIMGISFFQDEVS